MNTDFGKLGIVAIFRALWMGAIVGGIALFAPPIAATAAIVGGSVWGFSLLVSIFDAETDPGFDSEGNYYGDEPNAYQRLEQKIIDLVQEDIPDFFYDLRNKEKKTKKNNSTNGKEISDSLKQELKDALSDSPTLTEIAEQTKANVEQPVQEQEIEAQMTLKK